MNRAISVQATMKDHETGWSIGTIWGGRNRETKGGGIGKGNKK